MRAEGAHIGPDFGDDDLDRNPIEPWHFVGRDCACCGGIEGRNAFFLLFDVRRCCAKRKRWRSWSRPVNASARASRPQLSRSLPSAASFFASFSPTTIALKIRSPRDVADHG
jgi:hypothetical protein